MLYVLIALSHNRREIVHFNVTEHPTAQWMAQQIVEAFPFDSAPRYLLRDRDAIYGEKVQRRIRSLGIEQVVIAPALPDKIHFVNVLSGRAAEISWIMSLFSMSDICEEFSVSTLTITNFAEHIYR